MSRVNLESNASLQDAYNGGNVVTLAAGQPVYVFTQDASPLLRSVVDDPMAVIQSTATFVDAVTIQSTQVAVDPSLINQTETVVIAPTSLSSATNNLVVNYPLPPTCDKYVLQGTVFVSGPQGPLLVRFAHAASRPEVQPADVQYASTNPNYSLTMTFAPMLGGVDQQLSFSDLSSKQVYISYSLTAITP